jgi:hypothetical protein
MGRTSTKYDKKLLPVAIVLGVLALGNAIDYFFPTEKDFKKVKGKVTNIEIETYNGTTRKTRSIIYTKFRARVDNNDKKYYVIETGGLDTGLVNLRIGDNVEFRVKRWYQAISYFMLDGNLLLVRKDGAVIYDIRYKFRHYNKIFMMVFGAMGLLVFVIYLDIVHNISLENWFQKKVLKKGLD